MLKNNNLFFPKKQQVVHSLHAKKINSINTTISMRLTLNINEIVQQQQ